MNKSKRSVVIAGNWKMNKTATESVEILSAILPLVKDTECKVILAVPAINIPSAVNAVKGSNVYIAAQNCHWENSGAFTGEISANMLKEFKVNYAIIGHSERRQYFAETDETVNKRALTCLANNITPIVCVGENLAEREANITNSVIKTQITAGLAGFTCENIKNTIIAYEPVWAIGTGKTATSQQAQVTCKYIRSLLEELFDIDIAESVTIQYGGSMNAQNAKELLSMEDIDGGLIGGASLKAEDFSVIVDASK